MVVCVLLIAGDQVPVMPLVDVVGRAGMEVPLQAPFTALNEGVMSGVMVIVVETLCAHCPAFGVNA